uniref:hypothetical protein n=1 Tax=Sphingomonas sp. TaxID=28214 RepID=UPI0025EEB192|nr:hypothetical protein [Sphingomonas sp.]
MRHRAARRLIARLISRALAEALPMRYVTCMSVRCLVPTTTTTPVFRGEFGTRVH